MAGSFGYEHGHYDVSMALANRVLLPAAAADPEARLVAPGFSCRSQVHGLAGIDGRAPDRAPGRAARRDDVILLDVLGAARLWVEAGRGSRPTGVSW